MRNKKQKRDIALHYITAKIKAVGRCKSAFCRGFMWLSTNQPNHKNRIRLLQSAFFLSY